MNTEHEHYHEEAQVVAWSDIMVNGWKISVTARQGATSADIVANVLALGDALKTLREKYNATPYLNGNGNGSKAANAALATAAHAPRKHGTRCNRQALSVPRPPRWRNRRR